MTDPTPPAEPTRGPMPEPNKPPPAAEEHPLAGLMRAFKRFLVPFLLSWGLAYVGANLQLEWLYFAGLIGVGASMIVLLVWLIS